MLLGQRDPFGFGSVWRIYLDPNNAQTFIDSALSYNYGLNFFPENYDLQKVADFYNNQTGTTAFTVSGDTIRDSFAWGDYNVSEIREINSNGVQVQHVFDTTIGSCSKIVAGVYYLTEASGTLPKDNGNSLLNQSPINWTEIIIIGGIAVVAICVIIVVIVRRRKH